MTAGLLEVDAGLLLTSFWGHKTQSSSLPWSQSSAGLPAFLSSLTVHSQGFAPKEPIFPHPIPYHLKPS